MMGIDSFVAVCGAVQGLALGVGVGTARRGEPAANRALGMVLVGGALAMGTIALSHAAWLRSSDLVAALLELLETTATLAVGPLLLLYVRRASGRGEPVRPLFALHFTPAVLWLGYAVPAVARAAAQGVAQGVAHEAAPRLLSPPILLCVAYQMLYTGLAVGVASRGRGRSPAAERWRTWSLLAFMIALHAAQIVRFGFRHVAELRNVVPLVGAAGFFVLTVAGLRRSTFLTLRSSRRSGRPAVAVVDDERTRRIAERLRCALEEERLYRDPDLSLGRLAADVGVPRTLLSRLVNQRFGTGYLDLVNGYRVREAARLLADPANGHLTVDAVAERCGFRSRSTFYDAFRRHTGTTPSRLRPGSGD